MYLEKRESQYNLGRVNIQMLDVDERCRRRRRDDEFTGNKKVRHVFTEEKKQKQMRLCYTFICLAFKSHTEWSNVRRVSAFNYHDTTNHSEYRPQLAQLQAHTHTQTHTHTHTYSGTHTHTHIHTTIVGKRLQYNVYSRSLRQVTHKPRVIYSLHTSSC